MKTKYSVRIDDPFKAEIERRLKRGEKPYDKDHTPHVLAGDTYLVDNGHGTISLEIG